MVQTSRRLRLDKVDGVTVVSFADTRIVEDEVIKEVGEELYSLVEDKGHNQLLINFGHLELCSSVILGKLVNLQKRVAAVNGQLKLCGLKPDLLHIFRITNLEKVFEIYADEQTALDKF